MFSKNKNLPPQLESLSLIQPKLTPPCVEKVCCYHWLSYIAFPCGRSPLALPAETVHGLKVRKKPAPKHISAITICVVQTGRRRRTHADTHQLYIATH